MVQVDKSLTQTDDIHSVKRLGTSLLVHVACAANALSDLHFKLHLKTLEHFAAHFQSSSDTLNTTLNTAITNISSNSAAAAAA